MTNTIIGRVVATEKHPTTIDDFTFWTDPELKSIRYCKSSAREQLILVWRH